MLLLLHGALADHSQFDTLVERADIPATRFSFAGHGTRPLSEPLRMQRLVNEAAAHLDAQGIAQAAVFGYSMGGYVGLLLAALMPERITHVVTLATKFDWSPDSAEREASQLSPDRIRAKVPRFAAQLEARHVGAGWERLLAETAAMMRLLGANPLLDATHCASISARVRVCVGDRDSTASIEETRAVQKLINHAELEVFPGTPHPFERVPLARLVFTLREFLDS